MLAPKPLSQSAAESLCEAGFAAAAADDLGDWQFHSAEHFHQFRQSAREVAGRDGTGMRQKLDNFRGRWQLLTTHHRSSEAPAPGQQAQACQHQHPAARLRHDRRVEVAQHEALAAAVVHDEAARTVGG